MSTAMLNARVPLVERDEAAADVQPLYDKLLLDRGVVPNMFKALSNVPGLPQGVAAFLKPLLSDGALKGWYKELISIRIGSLNDCEYCVSAHRYSAKQKGASAEQIGSVDSFEAGPFTEREKAGFRYAELLHESGHEVDDAAYAAVSEHFNAAELIELTMVAAAFEMFPRFITALRIPVTKLPE